MDAVPLTKVCTKCRERKPVEMFDRHSRRVGLNGYQAHCKACRISHQRAKRAADPAAAAAYIRAWNLRKKYGLSLQEFEQLMMRQDGCCAICHQPPRLRRFVNRWKTKADIAVLIVDHDHRTGAVRGLLCNECNRALGLFHEDPALLHSALEYVTGTPGARGVLGG